MLGFSLYFFEVQTSIRYFFHSEPLSRLPNRNLQLQLSWSFTLKEREWKEISYKNLTAIRQCEKKKVFSWIEPSDGFFGRKMIRTNILEITEINSRTLFEPHLLMLTAYFFHSDICGWSRIYGMMTEIDLKLNWFLE